MYTGKMIDELVDMVMRAEQHAVETRVREPEIGPDIPRFFYDLPRTQPMLIGVA